MADSKKTPKEAGDRAFRRVDFAFAWTVLGFAWMLALAILAYLFCGRSEDFRNWMLGFAPLGAAYFWWRRNQALKRQADADEKQAEIGRIRLADERFAEAVGLLSQNDKDGRAAIGARLGGIFILEKLAIPEYATQVIKTGGNLARFARPAIPEYAAQVIKTLVAYIKENIQKTAEPRLDKGKELKKRQYLGEDVKAALAVLNKILGAHKYEAIERVGLTVEDFSLSGHDLSLLEDLHQVGRSGFFYGSLFDANMVGSDLGFADLRGANLCYADLRDISGYRAELEGAELESAKLQGADFSEADLLYADFSDAELDETTELPLELSGKIWHSGQEEFKKRKIRSRSWSAKWDLWPFYSADSLVSVLRRYADVLPCFPEESMESKRQRAKRAKRFKRALKLRQAACALLKSGKLPEGFPQYWRDWLGAVDDEGHHPDDPPFF